MIYKLYSVKDVLTGDLSQIQLFVNNDIAKRWFYNLCQESKIAKDLQLFELGTFDIKTGVISPKFEFVASGSEVENG